jgi:hypothetical protein
VSLRRDMHSAFDEIAPSTAGLPERVVQTVLVESSGRQRRERLMFRLRGPMALVAVFVVIAMVVGVLIAGRVIQDWNAHHDAAPAGGINQTDLAALEARPLNRSVLLPSDPCPDGPTDSSGDYGTGPVRGIPGGRQTNSSWGTYWDLQLATNSTLTGLVLVRAWDLRANQPFVFVGQYAAGSGVGADSLSGQTVVQRPYLVLDMAHAPGKPNADGQIIWNFTVGVPRGNSGCFGWQFDGPGFTEKFTFAL